MISVDTDTPGLYRDPLTGMNVSPSRPNPGTRRSFQEERTQRFQVGDKVNLARGEAPASNLTVTEVVCDPVGPTFFGGTANNAKYRLEGLPFWVYDWMLDPA